jgi:hypothetical protein
MSLTSAPKVRAPPDGSLCAESPRPPLAARSHAPAPSMAASHSLAGRSVSSGVCLIRTQSGAAREKMTRALRPAATIIGPFAEHSGELRVSGPRRQRVANRRLASSSCRHEQQWGGGGCSRLRAALCTLLVILHTYKTKRVA